MPSADPNMLPHLMPHDLLDEYFPRAPVVESALGEPDEEPDDSLKDPAPALERKQLRNPGGDRSSSTATPPGHGASDPGSRRQRGNRRVPRVVGRDCVRPIGGLPNPSGIGDASACLVQVLEHSASDPVQPCGPQPGFAAQRRDADRQQSQLLYQTSNALSRTALGARGPCHHGIPHDIDIDDDNDDDDHDDDVAHGSLQLRAHPCGNVPRAVLATQCGRAIRVPSRSNVGQAGDTVPRGPASTCQTYGDNEAAHDARALGISGGLLDPTHLADVQSWRHCIAQPLVHCGRTAPTTGWKGAHLAPGTCDLTRGNADDTKRCWKSKRSADQPASQQCSVDVPIGSRSAGANEKKTTARRMCQNAIRDQECFSFAMDCCLTFGITSMGECKRSRARRLTDPGNQIVCRHLARADCKALHRFPSPQLPCRPKLIVKTVVIHACDRALGLLAIRQTRRTVAIGNVESNCDNDVISWIPNKHGSGARNIPGLPSGNGNAGY